MRIWQCGLAAALVPLLFASPAVAKEQAEDGSVRPVETLGYAEVLGPRNESSALRGALFPQQPDGLGVSSRRGVDEDGSRQTRNGIIASTEVGENMHLGLGIFSVTRYSPRERDFKREQPMKDVGQRTGSLAAVGFSVRF